MAQVSATLTVNITVPTSVDAALNPDAAARVIAKEALQQIVQAIGDPRQTSGSTNHMFGFGDVEVTGSWTWTPPS